MNAIVLHACKIASVPYRSSMLLLHVGHACTRCSDKEGCSGPVHCLLHLHFPLGTTQLATAAPIMQHAKSPRGAPQHSTAWAKQFWQCISLQHHAQYTRSHSHLAKKNNP